MSEVKAFTKLSHPNLIEAHQIIVKQGKVHIVLELMQRTLLELLKAGPLSRTATRNIMFQVMSGLQHIHSHQYIHRDIKPENLYLRKDEVKIGDFGLLKERGRAITPYVSTRWYRAPELILGLPRYD